MSRIIRTATPDDAERLLEIYGYYVEKTAISFEYDVPSIRMPGHFTGERRTGIPVRCRFIWTAVRRGAVMVDFFMRLWRRNSLRWGS